MWDVCDFEIQIGIGGWLFGVAPRGFGHGWRLGFDFGGVRARQVQGG
jgi:hypothetical protein